MDTAPSWSRDGGWIYFASNRSGEWQIWKIPNVGGEPVQITKAGGIGPLESQDGRYLYYAERLGTKPDIWRVPVNGGKEELVLEGEVIYQPQWTLWENSIVYSYKDEDGKLWSFLGNQMIWL